MRTFARAQDRANAPAPSSLIRPTPANEELTQHQQPVSGPPVMAGPHVGYDLSRVPVSSPALGTMPTAQPPVRVTQQSDMRLARDKDKTVLEKEGKTDATTLDDVAKVRRIVIETLSSPSSQLFPYIKDRLDDLNKGKTTYSIQDVAVFASKYRANAKKRKVAIDPSVKDEDLVREIGGFYDPASKSIYLKTRSNYCSAFHETIHSLSNPDVLSTFLGGDLMEGLTQYFTDVVFKEQLQDACHTHKYGDQLKCATKLVNTMHFDAMARLFFRSEVGQLPAIATKLGVKDTAALQALDSAAICARLP